MSRRSLRRPDPALDLSRHLLTLDQLPKPWNAAALFGREAPLELEVGSGKGLFISAAATERPEHNFLGVEIAEKYAEHCAARLARKNLPNARMIRGDAQRLATEWLPDASVLAIHVYFPDPWWKARHRKRRVMNEQFARHFVRILQSGGTLHFWTDVEEYYLTALEMLRTTAPELDGPLPVPERPPEHDLDYRTHFERRMRLHGEAVYRSEFVKRT